MAFQRISDKKIIGGDFSSFVDAQTTLFSRQMTIRNAEEEVKFNEAVLIGNITLQEQLDWRIEQKKRVKGDKQEVSRIRLEVANLTDRIEQRKFSDEYIEKLSGFESGATSIDSVVDWLESELAGTTDLRIQQTIRESLRTQKAKRFEIQKDIIDNETQFAINDKSAAILETHLEKVKSARTTASFAGDDLLSSVYDLQIQALEKAVTENGVERSITSFAVNTITNGMNALSLLDAYNGEVANAATSGNIQIGGSLFGNAKEFWRFKRGEYLVDNSGSGFFTRFTTERNQELGLRNVGRNLTMDDIRNITDQFEQLRGREELKNFDFQINIAKQNSVQTGTNYVASQVLSQFGRDFDVNKAVATLNDLKTLGGNVTSTFDKIIQIGAANKSDQVSNILNAVQQLQANDPNMSAEEAIQQAIGLGAGTVTSPEQLVGKTAEELTKATATGKENFSEDPRTTAPQIEAPPIIPETDETTPQQDAEARFTFGNQLEKGTSSSDVLELQKFLNKSGFNVATQGPGAVGSETSFFGPLTEAALQKFQKAQGIVSSGDPRSTGFGRLGPKTLAAINKFQF